MAVSPEEALKRTQAEEIWLKASEKEIDVQLLSTYERNDQFQKLGIEVRVPITDAIRRDVIDELLGLYDKAGWFIMGTPSRVRAEDQRHNDMLHIKMRAKTDVGA